jgi:hypothetical protein
MGKLNASLSSIYGLARYENFTEIKGELIATGLIGRGSV